MEPIFVKYRLQARVFDTVTKHILYTSDPPCPDCHAKPRCCMMKNNHSYVLKYDLKSLEQKQNDEGDRKRAFASEAFYINEEKDEDDEYCKLINCSYDIVKVVKDRGKVKQRRRSDI